MRNSGPHDLIHSDWLSAAGERVALQRHVAPRARGRDAILNDGEDDNRGDGGGDENRTRSDDHRLDYTVGMTAAVRAS